VTETVLITGGSGYLGGRCAVEAKRLLVAVLLLSEVADRKQSPPIQIDS
jgi:hypothetical protein